METIGIRELRQHASRIVKAAEHGTVYRVTSHGKDTGVTIALRRSDAEPTGQAGAFVEQARRVVRDGDRPPGFEAALLALVEEGRDTSGRVGGA